MDEGTDTLKIELVTIQLEKTLCRLIERLTNF